jgi:hypothetical protein
VTERIGGHGKAKEEAKGEAKGEAKEEEGRTR